MIKKSLWSILMLLGWGYAVAQLKSPDAFLPHKWGETFTPHHLLVDYVEHVAANSPNVKLTQYGVTNEQRPLLLAIISSPENLSKIEAIRQNNLRRTGLLAGQPDPALADIAIVWLSFSVHGNEAAGSEASMQVLYELANTSNAETQAWLRNTVVLIDPSLNPDGYSRYTHWYRGVANQIPDPTPGSREHREPWPGGRVNHYYFDLNRDWAWQTQVESQQRVKTYHQWMPHIHADLHEQYHNNPYYFAPAAQPYHQYLTKWQNDFQVEIGRNHARYFDSNGWLYFTHEVFDLLYPSYGDTYPMFNGSIGMTYEQGGHSRGGRAISMANGDTLTLKDRVMHHRTTALSTVEIASKNAGRVAKNFADYFQQSRSNPPGKYKTYIVKGSNTAGKLKGLCALLDKNGIVYGKAEAPATLKAYNYQTGQETSVKVESNDLVISAYQPLAVLTQVLFDPEAQVVDSATYDVTGWSLPYAHGVETYASDQQIKVKPGYEIAAPTIAGNTQEEPYALLAAWQDMNSARFLGQILQKGVVVRYATSAFTIKNQSFDRGTLIITRADNRKKEGFEEIVRAAATKCEQTLAAVGTGFADSGNDLGSASMTLIKKPKVAVLSGESTFDNEFGQVWHYFERDLQYPLSIFDAESIGSMPLDEYNLLIMPEGEYDLKDAAVEKLNTWISKGGRLIAIGYALSSLEGKKGFGLEPYASDEEKSKATKAREAAQMDQRLLRHEDKDNLWLGDSNPGVVMKLTMDNSHPLGYGLPGYYFSLKTNTLHYQHFKNIANVGYTGSNLMVSGFIGHRAKADQKNTTVFAMENKGAGAVIYMVDNPLFRGFWENGKLLFSNAVFLTGR